MKVITFAVSQLELANIDKFVEMDLVCNHSAFIREAVQWAIYTFSVQYKPTTINPPDFQPKTIFLPLQLINYIDELKNRGLIYSRSLFIREAVAGYLIYWSNLLTNMNCPPPAQAIHVIKPIPKKPTPKKSTRLKRTHLKGTDRSKLGNVAHPELTYLRNHTILGTPSP